MLKKDCRPMNVFCNGYYPKADNLLHEVLLTDFLFSYFEFATSKRHKKCDKFIRPDAEMEMAGFKYYVEMDTGSVHHGVQKRRWRRYEQVTQDLLLVVTLSPIRMENLIRHANRVASIALFTTLDQVKEKPFGSIWRSVADDRTIALPKRGESGGVEKAC